MFLIYYNNNSLSDSIVFLGLTQTKEDADKIVSLYSEKQNYRYDIEVVPVSLYSGDQVKKMREEWEIASRAKEKLTEEEYQCLIRSIYERMQR